MRQHGEGGVVIAEPRLDLRQRPFRLRLENSVVRVIVYRTFRLFQRLFLFSEAGIGKGEKSTSPVYVERNYRLRRRFDRLQGAGEGAPRFLRVSGPFVTETEIDQKLLAVKIGR